MWLCEDGETFNLESRTFSLIREPEKDDVLPALTRPMRREEGATAPGARRSSTDNASRWQSRHHVRAVPFVSDLWGGWAT